MGTIVVGSGAQARRRRRPSQGVDYTQVALTNALNSMLEGEISGDLLQQEQEGARLMMQDQIAFQDRKLGEERAMRADETATLRRQIDKQFDAVKLDIAERGQQRVSDRQQSSEQHAQVMGSQNASLVEMRGRLDIILEQSKQQGLSLTATIERMKTEQEIMRENMRMQREEYDRVGASNLSNNVAELESAMDKEIETGDEAFVRSTNELQAYQKSYGEAMNRFGRKSLAVDNALDDILEGRVSAGDGMPRIFDATGEILNAMRKANPQDGDPNSPVSNAARDTLSTILEGDPITNKPGLRQYARGFDTRQLSPPVRETKSQANLTALGIGAAQNLFTESGTPEIERRALAGMLGDEVGHLERSLGRFGSSPSPNPDMERANAATAQERLRAQYLEQRSREIGAERQRSIIPTAPKGLRPAQNGGLTGPPAPGGEIPSYLLRPQDQSGSLGPAPGDVVAQMLATRMGYA